MSMKGSMQGRKGRMLSPLLQASEQFTQLCTLLGVVSKIRSAILYVEDCIVSR